MKKINCFDIHDRDVPAVVYQLLFALVETSGNDRGYKIVPSQFLDYFFGGNVPVTLEERWAMRHKRGPNNCYFNREEMVKLHENWPPLKDAIQQFIDWLKSQGINPDEPLHVKLWW